MFKSFRQFVPSSICLKCDGCCRFKEADSHWRPYIAQSEKVAAAKPGVVDKVFGEHVVGSDQRLKTTPCAQGHLCHFLNARDNTCGIYHARPFECQLYPFLLGREAQKIVVYVHLNCPHIQDHWNDQSYRDYAQYLKGFFKRDDVQNFLKANPGIIGDYAAHRDELDFVFEVIEER